MKTIRHAAAVLLVFTLVAYGQGNTFNKIRYNGGTIETKVDPEDWGNRLTVTSELIELQLKDGQILKIDPKLVSGLSYGQEAHRRVGTMVVLGIFFWPALFGLFHKTRQHFIGIEYTTAEGKKAGLLLQGHKDNYRAVLMALRGVTGAPVVVSEEDRKYVPTGIAPVVSESQSAEKPSEQSEQSAEESQLGLVQVSCNVEAAEAWVDGKFVGNVPAKLSLPPGKHSIRVSFAGYESWEREIEVLPKSEVTLNAILTKK